MFPRLEKRRVLIRFPAKYQVEEYCWNMSVQLKLSYFKQIGIYFGNKVISKKINCKPSEFSFWILKIQESLFEINTDFTMIIPTSLCHSKQKYVTNWFEYSLSRYICLCIARLEVRYTGAYRQISSFYMYSSIQTSHKVLIREQTQWDLLLHIVSTRRKNSGLN